MERRECTMENQEQQRRRETHAPERNPNPCPLYRKCGGCQLQNMSYQRQLHWKQELVERLLGRFHRVNPIIGMEHPYHYRNKVQAAFALDRRKQIVSGVYQASTHRVVPVESCMIEDETADRIVGTIRKLMKDFKMEPYNEDTGRGLVRHVLVKRGFVSGQVMVVMVTVSPILPAKNNFVKALRKAHPEITTILQNVNNRATSMVLGESEKVLYGPGYIEESLCGCVFRISAKSFYQINPVQTEVLYNKAIELAGFTGKETVVDAYCGTGTIGLIAAKRGAGHVTGVELNQDAVRDAISNAKRNGIKNVYFYNADAGEFLSAMADEGETVDVVLMDPPRAGSDEQFLTSLAGLAPKKIVYISCNPETLQRDLQFLVRAGYHVQEIQPVDMFPHTNHVETVVLLSKGEIDSKKVRVEFSLEDMDMSGFQKGATYEQIKAYVLEHTGLKVSSLYISQIKRKCGLDVGQNYNLSKKEDAKVPQCPPEKEAAIMEALKHFQMI
ncbi:23S rRNA (uracil(1939)-C(5))-methyltransferase RlmD [Anaeromassilibacillus sp. An250]|nr:23S rRNA (uracil(1939)-C(5))-methyltransferase RlmD [Anaeromassilibacillus sp. An250]